MSDDAIHARGVCFAFGEGELRKQILYQVDLDVRPGEIVFLTGPSGSGKTTLLTLAGALRTLEIGRLRVLDVELNGADKAARVGLRRRVGFIFQTHNLLSFLTARQNVDLALELHPEIPVRRRDSAAAEVLAQVGLGEKLDSFPDQLSVGQRQRVAVARALVGGPELILADEPTAALDGQTGREVALLLQGLARGRGCAVLMVTHDSRILDVADRVVKMEDGRILQGE